MITPRRAAVLGVVLIAAGLTLALTQRAQGWFAWMGDDSFASAAIASGRVLVLGVPQYVGFGAALLGLLVLVAVAGFVVGRRREPWSEEV